MRSNARSSSADALLAATFAMATDGNRPYTILLSTGCVDRSPLVSRVRNNPNMRRGADVAPLYLRKVRGSEGIGGRYVGIDPARVPMPSAQNLGRQIMSAKPPRRSFQAPCPGT